MWIVQEVINATKITVLCGSKGFEWASLEALYYELRKIEDTDWLHFHDAAVFLHSSAAVMVWQRLHWRDSETQTPKLQTLVEVFQDWKCSDVRDKVFALAGIAD